MNKSFSIAGSALATALLLGACGANDDNSNDAPVTETDTAETEDTATEPGTVEDESADEGTVNDESTDSTTTEDSEGTVSTNLDDDQNYMKEKMDSLAYDEFELEVDYGKDTEYEVEIEQDNGQIEAQVEDELSNTNLKGREAFDEVYPKLEKMSITERTPKDEAIQQALEAFELKDDYVKFEIEITMPDGKKIEFEDKK